MPFRPLVELRVRHPYFASGEFSGARLVPDAATAARLRGLRLVIRAGGGATTVFVDLDDAGLPRIAIPDGTPLGFDLQPLPPDLALATEPLPPGTVFVADGANRPLKATQPATRATETLAKPAGPAVMVLAGRPPAGTARGDFAVVAPAGGVAVTKFDAATNRVTLTGPEGAVTLDYPAAPPRAGGAARIALTIGPAEIAAAAAGTPRAATIALRPSAARWCYHLVTDLPDPLGDWRIARANGAANGGGPAVTFDDAGRAELTADDAGDPFGSALRLRSAPLRVLRFVSTAAIPASETAARRVQLFAGARQLFAALPNPSPAQPRQLGGVAAFGEVVRIVTA